MTIILSDGVFEDRDCIGRVRGQEFCIIIGIRLSLICHRQRKHTDNIKRRRIDDTSKILGGNTQGMTTRGRSCKGSTIIF